MSRALHNPASLSRVEHFLSARPRSETLQLSAMFVRELVPPYPHRPRIRSRYVVTEFGMGYGSLKTF